MLNLLVGPLASIVKDAVGGYVQTKKAKQELKLTEIKATQKLNLPTYYHNLLYIAISASFGIKAGAGAMNLFKKK